VDNAETVLFRERDIRSFQTAVTLAGHDMTTNFELGSELIDQHIDVAPFSSNLHLKMSIGRYVSTSFGIIVRKGLDENPVGSASPIESVRRESRRWK
jgi:hypothetical protein